MAVLEFFAFFGGILAFHSMIRGFKVSLFTDSTVVESVANNGKANSELMQMVHTALLASAAFVLLGPSARTQYITTEANAFSHAGTRPQLATRFAAFCEQAGVRARRVPPPAELPALLDALWLLGVDIVARAPPPGGPFRRWPRHSPSRPGFRFGEASHPGPWTWPAPFLPPAWSSCRASAPTSCC
jgi:hypothetical protein